MSVNVRKRKGSIMQSPRYPMVMLTPGNVKKVLNFVTDYANNQYVGKQPALPFQAGRIPTTRQLKNRLKITPRKTTSTPMGTTRFLPKRGGAVSSRSSGFFSKGTRKYKRNALNKYRTLGVNTTIESSKVQTGTNCVWIGHSTFARDAILREAFVSLMFRLLLKWCMIRQNTHKDEIIDEITAGDVINFRYRTIPTATGVEVGYTVPAGGTTLTALANWFTEATRPWMTAGSNDYETEIQEIAYNPAAGSQGHSEIVDKTKFHIYCKSTLKIQNRSKATATGDEQDNTDVVDNVPVYGKSYSGRGSGLLSKVPYGSGGVDIDLLCDRQTGTIIGSESWVGRSEPPQGSDFFNAKTVGKAHLDPGYIKTSVLTQKHTMTFSSLLRLLAPKTSVSSGGAVISLGGYRIRENLGKFRVFAMEKMIDTGATETITIALENNLEISCVAQLSRTTPIVAKEFRKYQIS